MFGCVVRGVRVVDIDGFTRERTSGFVPLAPPPTHARPGELVDVRIVEGEVTEVGPDLPPRAGETVHDGGGRWAIPGLWDAHVHMGQWAATTTRLDVADATSAAEVASMVAREVVVMPPEKAGATIAAFGFRSATWHEQPQVADLDAISGEHPVVVISGDCHAAWLNSRALHLLGLDPRESTVFEQEWFDVFPRVSGLPGLAEQTVTGYRRAADQAAARGVTGIIDLEFARGVEEWPDRFSTAGINTLRVRVGTYPDGLEDLIAAGRRTGQPLGDSGGLLRVGPLKIISDGSLNTRTAYCCEPYADADDILHPHGVQNVDPQELRRLLSLAAENGLEVALHAIGDAAVRDALDAFEVTGARGSVEHAQLVSWEDIPRMGRLGVRASVQPAHLWDDRDVARQCWPDRADRLFPFRSLVGNGVRLALGSDAPVSPLDPWLAMAAAVHRSADEREPWMPHQALTPAEALVASLDGQGTIAPGSRGDVVLLDADPLAVPADSREACDVLREMPVAATIVAGRLTHAG